MKTETLKAEFTTFDKSSQWVSGKIGEYNFEAKLFDEGSIFGIKKGRVSKLSIYTKREKSNVLSVKTFQDFFSSCIVNYDRGWDIRPIKEHKPIFNAVMQLLENSPKRFENETEIENLINKALQ